MSSIESIEKQYFEILLRMENDKVLNFSDGRFTDFFNSHSIDIYSDEYYTFHGCSNANMLRNFWSKESDVIVGKVLIDLLEIYIMECKKFGERIDRLNYEKACSVVERLTGEKLDIEVNFEEHQFPQVEFNIPDLEKLPIEPYVLSEVKFRLVEANKVFNVGAYLSSVILFGSVLEAVLFGIAERNLNEFNETRSRLKSNKKVPELKKWSLADLIKVACDIEILSPVVKEHGHGLRNFRNYIHPKKMLDSKFKIDKKDAEINLKALEKALEDLVNSRK